MLFLQKRSLKTLVAVEMRNCILGRRAFRPCRAATNGRQRTTFELNDAPLTVRKKGSQLATKSSHKDG